MSGLAARVPLLVPLAFGLAFGALCIGLSGLLGLAYRELRHAE